MVSRLDQGVRVFDFSFNNANLLWQAVDFLSPPLPNDANRLLAACSISCLNLSRPNTQDLLVASRISAIVFSAITPSNNPR